MEKVEGSNSREVNNTQSKAPILDDRGSVIMKNDEGGNNSGGNNSHQGVANNPQQWGYSRGPSKQDSSSNDAGASKPNTQKAATDEVNNKNQPKQNTGQSGQQNKTTQEQARTAVNRNDPESGTKTNNTQSAATAEVKKDEKPKTQADGKTDSKTDAKKTEQARGKQNQEKAEALDAKTNAAAQQPKPSTAPHELGMNSAGRGGQTAASQPAQGKPTVPTGAGNQSGTQPKYPVVQNQQANKPGFELTNNGFVLNKGTFNVAKTPPQKQENKQRTTVATSKPMKGAEKAEHVLAQQPAPADFKKMDYSKKQNLSDKKITEPDKIYQQKDSQWNNDFLGGTPSYDDKDKKTKNTVGEYGCLFCAVTSIAQDLAKNKNITPKTVNKEEFFNKISNSRGGEDVNLKGIEQVIEAMTNNTVDVIVQQFPTVGKNNMPDSQKVLAVLEEIVQQNEQPYVIIEFKTSSGSHFVVAQNIICDDQGKVIGIRYQEQYAGYINKTFTNADIKSIITIQQNERGGNNQ